MQGAVQGGKTTKQANEFMLDRQREVVEDSRRIGETKAQRMPVSGGFKTGWGIQRSPSSTQ